MRVLLTGSSGFVGGVLAEHLSDRYELILQVRTLDDGSKVGNRSVFVGEIEPNTDWQEILHGVDVVIHTAAVTPYRLSNGDMRRVNVEGTTNLARQALREGVRRFIFISSIGVNGEETQLGAFSEADDPAPEGDYARSKLEAEVALRDLATGSSMEFVIIRPPMVYGRGARGSFGLFCKLEAWFPFNPFAGIRNERSLVSVHNLALFIHLCVEHPSARNQLFVLADLTLSIADLFDLVSEVRDRRKPRLAIPAPWLRFVGRVVGQKRRIRQLTTDLVVDSSKAIEMLGWKPRYSFHHSMTHDND